MMNKAEPTVLQTQAIRVSLFALALIPFSHMYVDIMTHIFPIALPILKDRFELSYAQVGLVATVLQLTSSVIQPFFGIISDRHQANWFIPVGLLWTGLVISLVGYVPSYTSLLALVFLAGFGTAAFHPRALKALADAAGQRRGLASATFMLGGNLGFALGPVVAAFLFLNWGLESSLTLVVPGFLIAGVLWHQRTRFTTKPLVLRQEMASPLRHDLLWGLVAVCMVLIIRSWVNAGTVNFLPLFVLEQGFDLRHASRLLFVFMALGALGSLLGGYLSDLWGRKNLIIICLGLYAPAMLIFVSYPGSWAAPYMMGLAGIAMYAPFTISLALAQELMPTRTGLASGLTLGLSFGVGGIGASAAGVISDIWGLQVNLIILAVMPLLGIPLISAIKER